MDYQQIESNPCCPMPKWSVEENTTQSLCPDGMLRQKFYEEALQIVATLPSSKHANSTWLLTTIMLTRNSGIGTPVASVNFPSCPFLSVGILSKIAVAVYPLSGLPTGHNMPGGSTANLKSRSAVRASMQTRWHDPRGGRSDVAHKRVKLSTPGGWNRR